MPEHKEEAGGKEIQVVIFRLAGEEFGLEIAQVREIIRMQGITPMPKAPEFIEGVINLRGQIVAVMDLAMRFGLKTGEKSEKSRIVVTEVKENIVGMIVDEVPEVLRIAEGEIEAAPEMLQSQVHADFIRGVGKVGGNRLVILLDVDKIMSRDEAKQVSEAAKE